MKYIENTLIKDEKIIFSPKVHKIVYARPLIFLSIFAILSLIGGFISSTTDGWIVSGVILSLVGVISFCSFIYDLLYYKFIEMAITNKRVVIRTGIMSTSSEELQWNKIESIEIRQGILGRILNYGDIYFSGTGASFVRFADVQNPWKVKSQAAEIFSN